MEHTPSHPSADLIHRFVFDNIPLRGEIVTLSRSFQDAVEHQSLDADARRLLGEFLAASVLLTETFKFAGVLTLQARGQGPVPLIVAETTHQHSLRGLIKFSEANVTRTLPSSDLARNVGDGVMTLTVDPENGQRYQGIVPLEKASVAGCVSDYFSQSEQLPTRMWMFSSEQEVIGLFLQALPPQGDEALDADTWLTVGSLADTLTAAEALTLDHETILHRLFHEFTVRLFEPTALHFACSCSRERSLNALTALTRDDALALLAERDWIEMNCEFCGAQYHFGEADLDELFGNGKPALH